MKKILKRKTGFTLIELLFVSILIGSGLLFVANAIQHAKEVNYEVMQSVIANQLATEGVEIVYQLRNTNFLKYEALGEYNTQIINSCRLAHNFDECYDLLKEHGLYDNFGHFIPELTINNEPKTLLKNGYYFITNDGGINKLNNCYYYYDKEPELQKNCQNIFQNIYAICQKNGSWVPCTGGHAQGGDESKYGHFYRYIEGIGNYDMKADTVGGASINQDRLPHETDAQEYRFCSRVFRVGMQGGEIEICATMTNFTD